MGLKRKFNSKGIFFSIDALIALLMILLVLLVAIPTMKQNKLESKIDEDILVSLSSITAEEFDNTYVQSLISSGIIKEPKKSILEQIGNFYVTDPVIATNIANEFLSSIETKENIGIWLENSLVSSKNTTSMESARQVETSRQIISGVMLGQNISGFSARAFLSSGVRTSYTYFGGYVGDGNISLPIEYNGTIKSVVMELAINSPFSVYVNDNLAGNFAASPSVTTPSVYNLPITNFHAGSNTLEIRGTYLYIAGGFVKLTYNSEAQYQLPVKYYFPGVDGLINTYDGFYVPNNITSMDISLHINSNKSFFLNIGNASIYRNTTNGVQTINLNNNYLSSKLNYNSLTKKTVPIRLGLENATFEVNVTLELISVYDGSATMKPYVPPNGAGLVDAHHILINEMGIIPNSSLGLVGYRAGATPQSLFHELSTNFASINSTVNSWTENDFVSSNRALCNGIRESVVQFTTNSQNQNPIQASVLMATGLLTHTCSGSGTEAAANTAAVTEACNAYQQYGIKFYTIGFGTNQNTLNTLQTIANCSDGAYFYGELTNISQIYRDVINKIVAAYRLQTIYSSGGSFDSRIYPDSYIQFNYPLQNLPYGLIITTERTFDNTTSVSFSLPPNSQVAEARVVSYSGPKWTKLVKINNMNVFNLTEYGTDYVEIGDPYAIQIPTSLIQQSNNITLLTGSSEQNSSVGSASNKVIYTVIKNVSAYSPISANRKGCIWTVHFEDNTNTTLSIPQNASSICTYSPISIIYDVNDALQAAVYNLFRQLDLDTDGRVDLLFNATEVSISTTQVEGIPFPWSTEIQVRRWI